MLCRSSAKSMADESVLQTATHEPEWPVEHQHKSPPSALTHYVVSRTDSQPVVETTTDLARASPEQTRSETGESAILNAKFRQSSLEESSLDRPARTRLNPSMRTLSHPHKRPLDEEQDPLASTETEARPTKQGRRPPSKQGSIGSSPKQIDKKQTRSPISPPSRPVATISNAPNAGSQSHEPAIPTQDALTKFDKAAATSNRKNDNSSVEVISGGTQLAYLRQPATRPISEAQLINEVKGIYAGLVMVEKKCVEIVTQQSQSTKRLEDQQWKALVALHRTLLQEHHDFFSASQHPTASEPLKKLAVKYAMPARMWRHGIHAFLELLRHRLPGSMEHMLSFIYLSYSMMALLKESVPSFVETWIECLGDLARYRMAIEDSDPRDREIWSNVARMWYNEAADKSPYVGRIQHHLAVLARPNIVEQLFYYTKALVSLVPFVNARESIMLLFDQFLKVNEAARARYLPAEASFVHAWAILFVRQPVKEFYASWEQFRSTFPAHIDRIGPKLKVLGPQLALSLVAGMFDFGRDDSYLWGLFKSHNEHIAAQKQRLIDQDKLNPVTEAHLLQVSQREEFGALKPTSKVKRLMSPPDPQTDGNIANSETVAALASETFTEAVTVYCSKIGDKNIVPFMHAILANLWCLSFVPGALVFIEAYVPWMMLTEFLNTIGRSGISYSNIESESFPTSQGGCGKQLPDDFLLRGYITTQYYYPSDFWTGALVDDDERNVELPSHQAPRAERCLWLGVRIASLKRYIDFDYESKQFHCTPFAKSLTTA